MQITIFDDSIPYDGDSPMNQPLGGMEKAVVGVSRALAKRNHGVTVINRCNEAKLIEGVRWVPWDLPRPPEADVVIALRKPALFGELENADKRVLWLAANAKYLGKSINQKRLETFEPTLLFMSKAHKESWNPWKDFKTAIIEPGVGETFVTPQPGDEINPEEDSDLLDLEETFPNAVITTHPLHGLENILDTWVKSIYVRVPNATLNIFSAALYRGINGGEIPDKMKPLLKKIQEAELKNVVVKKPMADPQMADFYRDSDVHLYPRIESEVYCSTLAESQACGLPAVAFDKGAASECIRNGQTGFVVPDVQAFANVAVHMMTNKSAQVNLSRDARLMQRARNWDVVAAEFELLWS
ncbi:MAG: glycosyltransferase [Rhodospirillales bacterium]|nr:glycosyltransferase [Rhodospirillales bacterium]